MADYSTVCAQLQSQIAQLLEKRKQIRSKEKDLAVREQALSSQSQIRYPGGGGATLRRNLAQFIPAEMLPGNVGKLTDVTWPFYYSFDFDFGDDPALTSLSRQLSTVQVTQEAGFLLMGIYQNFNGYTEAGALGPYQVTIRDNQSTRQFNDRPIPVQMLGSKSLPTILPTPQLFTPNASITIEATTWLPDGTTMNTTGSSKFSIGLSGVRVRIEDAQDILSTVFGKKGY